MIRLICLEMDANNAAHVDGAPLKFMHKTFDVELPEFEKWLTAEVNYGSRTFVGIEVKP